MFKNKNTFTIIAVSTLILFAIASRVLNTHYHWYGFAPLVAISLFSGVMIKNKTYAFLLPLLACLLSDIALQLFTTASGFYGISQYFVYAAMVLVVLLGTKMKSPRALRILGFSLGGSAIFWIVSNFGVFMGGFYGFSLQGLVTTYLMAIPFYTPLGTEIFINSFVGDILFTGSLFGLYAIAVQFQKLMLASK